MSPHQKIDIRVRRKCLAWVLEHLNLLELRLRTKEIALLLIDVALSHYNYKLPNAELTCVTSILLAVKLEGDINGNLSSFLEYVFNKLRLSLHDIRIEEFTMVELLPPNFVLIPTPSDVMKALIELTNMHEQLQGCIDKLLIAGLNTYVQSGHELELFELCVQPLVLTTTYMQGHGKFLSSLNDEVSRMKASFSSFNISNGTTQATPLMRSSSNERVARGYKRVKNF